MTRVILIRRRYTANTITVRDDLERLVAEIRLRGFALDHGEYRPAMLGIAAPVCVRDEVPAALALSTPTVGAAMQLLDWLVERVVATAAALTLELGQGRHRDDGGS